MRGLPSAHRRAGDVAVTTFGDAPTREEARSLRTERRRLRDALRPDEPEDSERWRAWLDNRELLYRRCLGWTHGNATEAEDLLGQLLTRLLRVEAAEFQLVKCPRAWLTRVLRHLYVDHMRGSSRALGHDMDIERVLHGRTTRDPAAEVWRGELTQALRVAIDALPTTLKEPLVQRYIEGLDYEQIALHHHITMPAARKRCQLARDRIRQSLQTTLTAKT